MTNRQLLLAQRPAGLVDDATIERVDTASGVGAALVAKLASH